MDKHIKQGQHNKHKDTKTQTNKYLTRASKHKFTKHPKDKGNDNKTQAEQKRTKGQQRKPTTNGKHTYTKKTSKHDKPLRVKCKPSTQKDGNIKQGQHHIRTQRSTNKGKRGQQWTLTDNKGQKQTLRHKKCKT